MYLTFKSMEIIAPKAVNIYHIYGLVTVVTHIELSFEQVLSLTKANNNVKSRKVENVFL